MEDLILVYKVTHLKLDFINLFFLDKTRFGLNKF
jgi:hypothetical protein